MEVLTGEQGDHPVYEELKANTTDAAGEKHVPVVQQQDGKVTVTVGSVEHPMLEAHYIMWIYLETTTGGMIKYLKPGNKPEAEFILQPQEQPVAAYEYCNLHKLWKVEIK